MALNVLIIEDERLVALDIASAIRQFGYAVVGIADSGEEAVRLAELHHPDLVIADIRIRGSLPDGIEAVKRIRDKIACAVIYMTGYGDPETLRRAAGTNPNGYVLKPFTWDGLKLSIEGALQGWQQYSGS